MEENVKTFVEEYNKKIDWNKEILKIIDLGPVSDELKMFLDENVSLEKITEENYDLEHASLYEYGPDDTWNGTLELHAFSNKSYRTVYFWVKPALSEKEYKKERLEVIKKEMNEKIVKLVSEIDKLTKEKNELSELKEKISQNQNRI